MVRGRLLLVDNRKQSLERYAKVLRQDGYHVLEASSPQGARKMFARGGVDLAIIDLHLVKEGDPKDSSGLDLADAFAPKIPCILISGKPTTDAVLRALRKRKEGGEAVNFVLKADGPGALLAAVKQALVPSVFVAHGRDNVARLETVQFLERCGVRAIVLGDLSGGGRTIIEKFEEYANVSFAIVLLTPDDEGRLRSEATAPLKPRARQNVSFELGFFIGRLGRKQVVALHKDEADFELPSNYQGVEYVAMDEVGAWRMRLAREMKGAGIDIDMNVVP